MYATNVNVSNALVQKNTFNTFSMDFNKVIISSNSFIDYAELNIKNATLVNNTCTGIVEGNIGDIHLSSNSLTVGQLYYTNSFGIANNIANASHF